MNLTTGKVMNQRKYVELPITDAVIKQVHNLALAERQPKIKNGCPIFTRTEDDVSTFIDDDDEDDDDDYSDADRQRLQRRGRRRR
jgi:hypothetical protein